MPIRAQTRRDPQKGKNGFSAVKGFTLIELMIALGIIAIITSLALPSYRTIIEKRQVTSGAEQLAAFLSSAQMESVKRSRKHLGQRMTRSGSGFLVRWFLDSQLGNRWR